jgi:hypothetical protein
MKKNAQKESVSVSVAVVVAVASKLPCQLSVPVAKCQCCSVQRMKAKTKKSIRTSYQYPDPREMVTRSPVSSAQLSPSSTDFHTLVPYAPRLMALLSVPCSTRVLPVHERLPSRVAPWAKSGRAEVSSFQVLPPSCRQVSTMIVDNDISALHVRLLLDIGLGFRDTHTCQSTSRATEATHARSQHRNGNTQPHARSDFERK